MVIAARRRAGLEEVAAIVAAGGGRATVLPFDAGDASGIRKAIGMAGPLDGLVNNAGSVTREPFLEASETEMDRVLGLNVKGATIVAKEMVELCSHPNYFKFTYDEKDTLWDKMKAVATKIYGASEITADSKVRAQIKQLQDSGYGHYPVCVAKTQYSFSTDPKLRGAPTGHVVNIREVRLAAGAEFVVMICGDIMTMPGLPKVPSANKIDLVDGKVVGLF